MNYKTKSLIYLLCFIASALVYYHISDENELDQKMASVAQTEMAPEAKINPDNEF